MIIDPFGRTLAFPPQPDGRGGLLMVEGAAAVDHHIRAIVATMIGSHPFEPEFGWPIEVFMPVGDADVIQELIRDAIINWEDRIEPRTLDVIASISDEGELNCSVTYALTNNATKRALAFGFRYIPATEIIEVPND